MIFAGARVVFGLHKPAFVPYSCYKVTKFLSTHSRSRFTLLSAISSCSTTCSGYEMPYLWTNPCKHDCGWIGPFYRLWLTNLGCKWLEALYYILHVPKFGTACLIATTTTSQGNLRTIESAAEDNSIFKKYPFAVYISISKSWAKTVPQRQTPLWLAPSYHRNQSSIIPPLQFLQHLLSGYNYEPCKLYFSATEIWVSQPDSWPSDALYHSPSYLIMIGPNLSHHKGGRHSVDFITAKS